MIMTLPQVLIKNSFNILGLSSSAGTKEVRKRAQQLLQLAKIEERVEFERDIGCVREMRNEGEIRDALVRISGIKERLSEVFFWFEDHNTDNLRAVALISKGNFQEAIRILEKKNKEGVDWLAHKNLALSLIFQAFASSDFYSFLQSLKLWKSISESEDFWKFYEKHYLFHDELGASFSLFQEFRGTISESLSELAVSFYDLTKSPEAVGIFYSVFGQIGKSLDSEVLQPVVLKIKNKIEDLEKIVSSSIREENMIKQELSAIYGSFLWLNKFGLSKYSPLIVLGNDSAEKLRSISIDIYNNHNNSAELALLFLEQSRKLAVSETIATMIDSDKKLIKKNELLNAVSVRFEKVIELIAQRKFEESKMVYLQLDSELTQKKNEASSDARVDLLNLYCNHLMSKGQELFSKKMFGIETLAIDGLLNWRNHRDAIYTFEHSFEMVKNRLYLLSFHNPVTDQDSITKMMDSLSSSLKSCDLTALIGVHQAHLNTIEETANQQQNEKTQKTIKVLGAALCFGILYRRLRGFTQRKTWKAIGWATIFLFWFLSSYDNGQPETESTRNSTYHSSSSYSVKQNTSQADSSGKKLQSVQPVAKNQPYASSSLSLTYQEKAVIGYLQEHKPEDLENARNRGYSEKQIAQYVINHPGNGTK